MEKKSIIRCNRSGVFYGEVKSQNGSEVEIENARCLWYWDGAASLIQLAAEGVTKPQNCKFTMRINSLVVLDAIEILPCSEQAIISIEAVPEWKA